jgi:hypothetical protein
LDFEYLHPAHVARITKRLLQGFEAKADLPPCIARRSQPLRSGSSGSLRG